MRERNRRFPERRSIRCPHHGPPPPFPARARALDPQSPSPLDSPALSLGGGLTPSESDSRAAAIRSLSNPPSCSPARSSTHSLAPPLALLPTLLLPRSLYHFLPPPLALLPTLLCWNAKCAESTNSEEAPRDSIHGWGMCCAGGGGGRAPSAPLRAGGVGSRSLATTSVRGEEG